MKNIVVVIVIVCGFAFCGTPAYAEHIFFDVDALFNWRTSYTYSGAGTWVAGTAANPSNPYDGSVSQDLVDGVITTPDGKEDSFGITRINTIIDLDNLTALYDRGLDPYELTVFFYGFDDTYISGTANNVTLFSLNGHALVYKDFPKDYSPPSPPNAATDRTAVDQMNKVTNGTLVLDLTPHLLVDPVAGAFTLENYFDFTMYRGAGSVYFDVTGGSWQNLYDTNAMLDGSDISFIFSDLPAVIANPGVLNSGNWLLRGNGEGEGNIVPEPAAMFLFGMGGAGMVLVRRKKKLS